MSEETEKEVDEIEADKHWEYTGGIISRFWGGQFDSTKLDKYEYLYKQAFKHGWKHGVEWCKK